MDKTFIDNLRVRCILGVNDWERTEPQEIRIGVTVFSDTRPATARDDLAGCVDYDRLAGRIRELAEKAQRFTVEALAGDIAGLCLAIPGVRKVTVRVEKPGAVAGTDSVGVEIERP